MPTDSDTETMPIGLNGMKAKLISSCEAWIGSSGSHGWKVFIDVDREEFDGDDGWDVREAMETAIEKIRVRHTLQKLADPTHEKAITKAAWLDHAKALFTAAGLEPSAMAEIANGYCSKSCCLHRPWLEVVTRLGVITVGWRKRVLNIDWAESHLRVDGTVLFKDEGVTVGPFFVHAWTYEKVAEYLKALAASYVEPAALTAEEVAALTEES